MFSACKSYWSWPAIELTAQTCRWYVLSLGERKQVRASNLLPTWSALTENPNGVQSFSPGLLREAAATLGCISPNPTADCEAARSAKFIYGHPISPISPIRLISPSPKSTLIRVENGLIQALHRPATNQKSGLKIRESNRNQTVTNQKIYPASSLRRGVNYSSLNIIKRMANMFLK